MKKHIWRTLAVGLTAMLMACGGSGGGVPSAFDTIFDYIDDYRKAFREGGAEKANAFYEDFWKAHRLGSLTFPIEIEEGIPLEITSELEFRGGNINNGVPFRGNAKKTGDRVPNRLFLACMKGDQPVCIAEVFVRGFREYGENDSFTLSGSFDFKQENGVIAESQKDFDRVVLVRKYPDGKPAAGSDKVADDGSFTLVNGKLGPVEHGKTIVNLPTSVDGLYDKFDYKKEEHEDEMDGPWTEEYYLFSKGGKPVFRANLDGGKVFSIRLLEGSSFIKTPDGIAVGMSARDLFQQKKMQWKTYFEGEVFATKGHFTYYVSSDDLVGVDEPKRADHFKADAKVSGIVYN